jgi:hypothetical protein
MNPLAIKAFGALLIASVLIFGGCRWQHRLDASEIATLKADHAKVLADIAGQTQVVADKAAVARAAYGDEALANQAAYDKGVRDAYDRGKSAGAGIAAGTVRVRTVWRDRQCPQAPAGPGSEPGGRVADVDQGRADAIGRVLGEAGRWDAAYGLAFRRLQSAQGLLNTCFEKPAP